MRTILIALLVLFPLASEAGRSRLLNVYFPRGTCEEMIEVRLPSALPGLSNVQMVAPGSCLVVDRDWAHEDLEVRCVDPAGVKEPSPWQWKSNLNTDPLSGVMLTDCVNLQLP